MARYELTITPDYVATWGIWEALRELQQNSIDRCTESEDSEQILSYNAVDNTLIMGTTNSYLDKKTLLLGATSKQHDDHLIGQWGEGYKLAILVLLRCGMRIEIKNGNELWIPKIIKSRRFNSELVVIDTKKSKAGKDVIFTIKGISPVDFSEFTEKCLSISVPKNIIKTSSGNLLLDSQYRGKVYVSGLYVCMMEDDKVAFGYDMKPENIALDRDRKKVTEFNLFWETGSMFAEIINNRLSDKITSEIIFKMKEEKIPDISHLDTHLEEDSKLYHDLCELTYQEFMEKYGVNAIPCQTKEEMDLIKKKYRFAKPILVEKEVYKYVSASNTYKGRTWEKENVVSTPHNILQEFYVKYQEEMSYSMEENFKEIIKKSMFWKEVTE
jgi:hypothetical protein